jgi:ribonuclease HII
MEKYICGIDENGFGPVLGPLVITGILTDKDIKISEYIKDSKIFYRNKKDFKKLEEIAIVLYYMIEKKLPLSPYEIYKKFVLSECAFSENICEKNIPVDFKIDQPDKILFKYNDFLEESYKLKEIRVKVICPYFFNEFISMKNSKFILNLLTFCKIIKELAEYKEIKFFCGKIGGLIYYKKYLNYFFSDYEVKTIEENENFSSYKISNGIQNFEVIFYKDVENISLLSSLSSILGKYIREIVMESIRKSLNIKEEISGYRDKKTKKMIEDIDFNKFRKECIIRNC